MSIGDNDRAEKVQKPAPAPTATKAEQNTPLHWSNVAGVPADKLSGICAWARWDEKETKITEAEFKRVSAQWLNHSPGSGKRPKMEVK